MAPPGDPFFVRLGEALRRHAARLPGPVREAHLSFIRSFERPAGGFAGRSGGADLYYTGFALPLLAAFGERAGGAEERFLRQCRPETVIDLWQWLQAADALGAALPATAGALLAAHRSADGGFGMEPGAAQGSLFWTFLAVLCLERLGSSLPPALAEFLERRRTPAGGFREGPAAAPATTNASAAGLFLAARLGSGPEDPCGAFLGAMQGPEGGVRAGPAAPIADLLSSFTALAALERAGQGTRLERAGLARFVDALALPGGGFAALPGDREGDVEYTFYGLSCQAILAGEGAPA